LLREKQPVPTTGEVFFCLVVLMGLRWLTLGMGERLSMELTTGISELAFVAMPPIFMLLLLNTRPSEALYLRWPTAREAVLGGTLGLLLLPPMVGLTQAVAAWSPEIFTGNHPMVRILDALHKGTQLGSNQLVRYVLAYALVPALCEEIAFRGFVLHGLHRTFRPRNAVLLSSFFYALFHMNVFLLMPTFVLGVILGLLTIRSRSLLPAICFHALHNGVLIALIPLSSYAEGSVPRNLQEAWPWTIATCVMAVALLVWWLYRKPYELQAARQQAADGRQQSADSGQQTAGSSQQAADSEQAASRF
jgi:sodium transport system permease protein